MSLQRCANRENYYLLPGSDSEIYETIRFDIFHAERSVELAVIVESENEVIKRLNSFLPRVLKRG